MANKKTLEVYDISAIITAQVTVQIEAKDFYDAIEKAKELSITDFIEPVGGNEFDDCDLVGISYIGAGDFKKGFKLK
jgi:hypothetical protein